MLWNVVELKTRINIRKKKLFVIPVLAVQAASTTARLVGRTTRVLLTAGVVLVVGVVVVALVENPRHGRTLFIRILFGTDRLHVIAPRSVRGPSGGAALGQFRGLYEPDPKQLYAPDYVVVLIDRYEPVEPYQ